MDDLYAWLKDAAWPLWLARGVDWERGGFYEALDLQTHRCAAPFRRLRVAARQIFVFSKAHEAGLAGAADAVRLGLGFLERHAVQTDGGYAWRFDLDHRPINTRRDLYDHAFVLLALSAATAVVGEDALRQTAVSLAAWLRDAFRHPAGGFLESLPPTLPRRQNPHMHLLEALLAANAAFGCAPFATMAQGVLDLFGERLFNQEAAALPEYFDDALLPETARGIFRVEPGHHCEWAWLLHAAEMQGLTVPAVTEPLLAFVDSHGLGMHGALVDELGSDGRVLAAGARLWPQTERLRAETLHKGVGSARVAACSDVLRAYLRPDGLWHERRGATGVFSQEPAPASSLYHLTGAILALQASARVR